MVGLRAVGLLALVVEMIILAELLALEVFGPFLRPTLGSTAPLAAFAPAMATTTVAVPLASAITLPGSASAIVGVPRMVATGRPLGVAFTRAVTRATSGLSSFALALGTLGVDFPDPEEIVPLHVCKSVREF